MAAHTMLCDVCGNRFDDADLEYIEEENSYRCSECKHNLAVEIEEEFIED